jgi:hypothetical protein
MRMRIMRIVATVRIGVIYDRRFARKIETVGQVLAAADAGAGADLKGER